MFRFEISIDFRFSFVNALTSFPSFCPILFKFNPPRFFLIHHEHLLDGEQIVATERKKEKREGKEKEKEKWVEYPVDPVSVTNMKVSFAGNERLINDDKKQRTKAPRVNFSIYHCASRMNPYFDRTRSFLHLLSNYTTLIRNKRFLLLHCNDKMLETVRRFIYFLLYYSLGLRFINNEANSFRIFINWKEEIRTEEILCNSILLIGCRIYYLLVLYIFVASKRDIFREN